MMTMLILTAFAEVLFGDIFDMFSALFRKYTSTFRKSGPLGKALCIAGGAVVVLWIINWLRY